MKHLFTILLTLILLISLTACGGNQAKETMGNIETNPGITEGSTAEDNAAHQETLAELDTTETETPAETETAETELQLLTDIDGSWHHHCFTGTDFLLFPGNYVLEKANKDGSFSISLSLSKKGVLFLSANPNQ